MLKQKNVFPESKLIRKTFIFRELDFPPEIKTTKKSLLRWFALSFGLISEKESRTTMLDVLDALFYFNFSKSLAPSTYQIQSFIKEKTGELVIEKLIRYHLLKLQAVNLIEKKKNTYSFLNSPYSNKENLKDAFNHHISKKIIERLNDLEDSYQKLSDLYSH